METPNTSRTLVKAALIALAFGIAGVVGWGALRGFDPGYWALIPAPFVAAAVFAIVASRRARRMGA
ncbi:MAG: hypothetical protein QM708_03785 [Propioniciclava sp.]|uniref:hypothetical protein n=1 Tax=Propioniciclava sp. TaxID=2038686 RepID=UPI0039E489FE